MEHMFKKFLALTTLIACFGSSAVFGMTTNNEIGRVTPKITIRSQGTNALRRIVGTADMMNLYDVDSWNGFFSIMPEYTRSFNDSRIAECLFGIDNCDCPSLLVQGLRVPERSQAALFANYFGLPSDYSSVVTFSPRIQNFLVDMFGYVGLDSCYEGMYAWIQFPVTWTKWDLGFCERIINAGDTDLTAGVATPQPIDRDLLQPSFQAYLRGNKISPFTQGDFTTNFAALECAKICGSDTNTSVSEVRFALGYNFLLCEDYHFGLNLQASAPTGNKVCSNFLFAAQNGNDKHWELGVGITGHTILWRCEDEESHLGFYLDANITHMFNSSQRRCFDLCGKPLSRYMTAVKMTGANGDNQLAEVGDADNRPSAVFSGEIAPLANVTTFNVDVKVAVNADVVAMFNYTCGNWSWDLGYNFWGRSCEKLSLDCKCPQTFAENTWALNGDSSLFGCEVINPDIARALSATDSEANIRGGSNFPRGPVTLGQIGTGLTNPNVDNAEQAAYNTLELQACSFASGQINTSIQPVFIKQSDINFAKTQGLSNKIFTHFGYHCGDIDACYSPFFGIGFEAEFGQHNGRDCNDSCDTDCKTSCKDDCDDSLQGDCVRCALSQWGIWLKGGLAFN